MRKYLFIAVGGAVGALMRFDLKSSSLLLNTSDPSLNLAVNIMSINTLGCFLLGVVTGVFSKTARISNELKLGITTGFIGGFTTFSTFCKIGINLLTIGNFMLFFGFLSGSVLLGMGFVFMGNHLGIRIIHPVAKDLFSRFSYDLD
jgi:CrcB protein